jgi:DNA-binding transcriptional MerR regulator/methylmalonyl-CoA mutase cobalamin-binding subunit
MSLSLNSVYNLKAVLKETGIKPDVLRAWERRYGLPMPQRTPGGHRLYSEHDIEVIKWLIARQNDGLSISRAVEMWKERLAQGHDPLTATQSSVNKTGLSVHPAIPLPLQLTGIDELRSHWLSACLNFNEAGADQALNQAFALYPVEFVCTELLQRGMVEIGTRWYENRASVQQEHFASALALRRLDALLSASAQPTRPQTIIVGCPANEWHTLTPVLLALFIRRRGYHVIYLGANMPAVDFAEMVATVRADLVVLAAQQLITAASLQQMAALIAARGGLVAFGGRIFGLHPDLLGRIAGRYLGGRLEGAIDIVEDLLAVQPVPPQAIPTSDEYTRVLKVFVAHRAFVENIIDRRLSLMAEGANYFPDAHKFMGDNIIAALQLGNINYLDSEIDWLKVLLQGHNLPGTLLHDYLGAYAAVVSQHLGGQALPLVQWFEHQLKTFEN